MITKRMLKFLPVIIYSAISLAIYQGSLYHLYELSMDEGTDPDEKTRRTTLAGIGIGIGESLGALINGPI